MGYHTHHKGVAVSVGVCVRQVQTSWIHGPQLPETLPAEKPGFLRRVLAALQQHRHQAGDDRLHRLTGTHLPQQPLLQKAVLTAPDKTYQTAIRSYQIPERSVLVLNHRTWLLCIMSRRLVRAWTLTSTFSCWTALMESCSAAARSLLLAVS